jgi:cysteinyl-tRNA synthetase
MLGQHSESAAPASEGLGDDEIERLIEARAAARTAKDFKESDRIRDQLAAGGVLLEDQPGGKTLWRRK